MIIFFSSLYYLPLLLIRCRVLVLLSVSNVCLKKLIALLLNFLMKLVSQSSILSLN